MTEDKGILIKNIYYMLAYAFQELKQNNYAEIKGEDFDDIYNLFAEILHRGISYQLKQGLYREYVAHNESLLTVRGRINMSETIRNRMRNNQQISCDYDTLTENNIYNQILVATTHVLLKHSDVKNETKQKLKKLMLFFNGVSVIDIHSIHWDSLRFDRNNRNYRMLLYICYFVVKEWLLTTEKGDFKMQSFSDDHLCRLFEKFVLAYYKKHHPELKPNAAQIGWNIVEEETDIYVLPIMQTDILLSMGERTLIIDTKYYSKILQQQYGKETIRNGHLYQLRTYVDEYDREHRHNVDGMLLYAKTKNDDLDDAQITHRDGYTLYIRTLDLNTDFENIKDRLESFVVNSVTPEGNKTKEEIEYEERLKEHMKYCKYYHGEEDAIYDGCLHTFFVAEKMYICGESLNPKKAQMYERFSQDLRKKYPGYFDCIINPRNPNLFWGMVAHAYYTPVYPEMCMVHYGTIIPKPKRKEYTEEEEKERSHLYMLNQCRYYHEEETNPFDIMSYEAYMWGVESDFIRHYDDEKSLFWREYLPNFLAEYPDKLETEPYNKINWMIKAFLMERLFFFNGIFFDSTFRESLDYYMEHQVREPIDIYAEEKEKQQREMEELEGWPLIHCLYFKGINSKSDGSLTHKFFWQAERVFYSESMSENTEYLLDVGLNRIKHQKKIYDYINNKKWSHMQKCFLCFTAIDKGYHTSHVKVDDVFFTYGEP